MKRPCKKIATLRRIWEENFYKEQEFIRQVVVRHNYVTLATRVISVPAAPSPASSSSSTAATATSPTPASSTAATATSSTPDENYAFFRPRANDVRLIQLGLTFSDEGGNLPKDPVTGESCTWEFNVKVAKSMDQIDDSFRQHLTQMGVDVDFNMKHAIHPDVFCIGFWCMDTLVRERISWVVFHGSGAFCPLLNILRAEAQLPERRQEFLDLAKFYFPKVYEVSQLMASNGLSGTLEEVAKVLGVGVTDGEVCNQAGRDSLLTLQVFLAVRERHFRKSVQEDRANLISDISELRSSHRDFEGFAVCSWCQSELQWRLP